MGSSINNMRLMAMVVIVCAFCSDTYGIIKPPTELLAPFQNQAPALAPPSTITSIKPGLPIARSSTPSPNKIIKNDPIVAKKKDKIFLQNKSPINVVDDFKIAKRSQQTADSTNNEILHYEKTEDLNGVYYFNFKTENGITHEERGEPKYLPESTDDDTSGQSQQVAGEYSYVAPDGTQIVMNYIANENGFQPLGAHIPTPPPIPDGIRRALQYIQSHQPS